jgi:hypothetical protein
VSQSCAHKIAVKGMGGKGKEYNFVLLIVGVCGIALSWAE